MAGARLDGTVKALKNCDLHMQISGGSDGGKILNGSNCQRAVSVVVNNAAVRGLACIELLSNSSLIALSVAFYLINVIKVSEFRGLLNRKP